MLLFWSQVRDVTSTCKTFIAMQILHRNISQKYKSAALSRSSLWGNVMICISFSWKCDRREGAVRKAKMSKLTNYKRGRMNLYYFRFCSSGPPFHSFFYLRFIVTVAKPRSEINCLDMIIKDVLMSYVRGLKYQRGWCCGFYKWLSLCHFGVVMFSHM